MAANPASLMLTPDPSKTTVAVNEYKKNHQDWRNAPNATGKMKN